MITISILMGGANAFASGGGNSKEDVLFSLAIVAFLSGILGMVYLFEFINRIRKDKDYREHLKLRVVNLISTVRTVFVKRARKEDDTRVNYSVSLRLN